MRRPRHTRHLVGAVLIAAVLSAPAATSAAPRPVARHNSAVIGHLAYVTKQSRVRVTRVLPSGHTSKPTRLGPITKPPAHGIVQVHGFVASGDGDWVAWSEVLTKRNGQQLVRPPLLVVRQLQPHHLYTLRTTQIPIGFAGDELVTAGARTSRLVLAPKPHLVKVPGRAFVPAAYPNGVVQVKALGSPPGPKRTEQVRLNTFSGTVTVLRNYVMSRNDPRIPERAFVSGDGLHLIVERGDHTDFGGIGPSSLTDEYSLSGSRTRHPLGHLGTAKAAWRVGAMSFAGSNDRPWAVWERATKHGAASVVGVHNKHGWVSIMPRGIAVAANKQGYVVAQPGKYVFSSDGVGVTRVPTGEALLLMGSSTRVLGVEGTSFAWVK